SSAVTIQVDREARNARSAIPANIGTAINAGNKNTKSRRKTPRKFAIGYSFEKRRITPLAGEDSQQG
ncbi:hypothetical protein L7Q18_32490, partial [Achromobacter xylosoxidans]